MSKHKDDEIVEPVHDMTWLIQKQAREEQAAANGGLVAGPDPEDVEDMTDLIQAEAAEEAAEETSSKTHTSRTEASRS